MVQSLVNVQLHIIFSTKDRRPLIHPSIEKELYGYMAGTCKQLGSIPFEIGGIEDHVHLLASLSKTIAFSDFIGKIKSSSSKWIKSQSPEYSQFSWQKGFGAFAIESTSFDNVRNYILNQKTHHKNKDFKEEFLMILKRYNVPYDEKYLWD